MRVITKTSIALVAATVAPSALATSASAKLVWIPRATEGGAASFRVSR